MLEKVGSLSQIDNLREVLVGVIDNYGLKHAAYYAHRLPGTENPRLVTTYGQEWIDRYVSMDYFLVDPVMAEIKRSILPVDWSKLAVSSKLSMNFFGEAKEFGIGKHGITLPIRGIDSDLALLSVTSDVSDFEWRQNYNLYMCEFQLLAHAIHAKLRELSLPKNANNNVRLSPRELQCLQWAARGKTSDDIAEILGITERVVRGYFESARTKLNAINKNQVVAKALGLGLIQPEIV